MQMIQECDINRKITLDNIELNYNYDDLNRLESKNINDNLRVGYLGDKTSYLLHTLKIDIDTYDNANYKDQLTKFNNDTITYDGIGNPLKIGNTTYNWSNGREFKVLVILI